MCKVFQCSFRLNAAKLYDSADCHSGVYSIDAHQFITNCAFSPQVCLILPITYNPIDLSEKTNDTLAQSLHSVYEGLKNDDKISINSGREDQRSEVLVTPVTVSDDESSTASIITTNSKRGR